MFAEDTLAGRRAAHLRQTGNPVRAAEALAYLQQVDPKLMADLVQHLPGGWDDEGPVAAVAGSWRALLRLCALNEAFARPTRRLEGRVALAEVQQPSISAGTKHFPGDDSYLIAFDSGLIFATFEFSQLLTAASWSTQPEVPRQDQMDRVTALAELQLAQHMMTAGATSFFGYLPDPTRGATSGELTHAAQLFVLAHELAHVLLRHAEQTPAPDSQSEHAADVLALVLLSLDLTDADVWAAPRWIGRLLGVRLLLCCLEVVENHTYVRRGKTHPPAPARWRVLREFAGERVTDRLLDAVDEVWSPWQECFERAGEGRLDLAILRRHYEAVEKSWISRTPPTTEYLLDLVTARRSLLKAKPLADSPDSAQQPITDTVTRVLRRLKAVPAERALTWRTLLQQVDADLRAQGVRDELEDRFSVAVTVADRLQRG